MCSRYELSDLLTLLILAERFGLDWMPNAIPEGEVRPTDRAPVIRQEPGVGRKAELLKWGFSVSWDTKPLINARAETLAERKTFRPYLESRCLVPATAYFEWQHDGRRRLKYRIAPQGMGAFAFAGLMGEGAYAIVTCAPEESIGHIHNRMPVILDPAEEGAWIDPATPFSEVAASLKPYRTTPIGMESLQPADPQGDLFA